MLQTTGAVAHWCPSGRNTNVVRKSGVLCANLQTLHINLAKAHAFLNLPNVANVVHVCVRRKAIFQTKIVYTKRKKSEMKSNNIL